MSKGGHLLSPDTLILVEDGRVSPVRDMLPEHLQDLEEPPSLPLEESLEAIQAYL